MRKRVMVVAGVVLVLVLVAVALAIPTFAQGPTTTPAPQASMVCGGPGFGFGGGSWATFDAAAKALGLTPEGLFSELHSGKTLTQIAEAKGIKLDAVQEAMKAVQVQAAQDALKQAVQDGRITQEQADWLSKGMGLGFWPKGGRFGGHGMGFRFGPSKLPTAKTTSS